MMQLTLYYINYGYYVTPLYNTMTLSVIKINSEIKMHRKCGFRDRIEANTCYFIQILLRYTNAFAMHLFVCLQIGRRKPSLNLLLFS